MNLIDRSLALALSVHSGQTDRYGAPYILHPLRMALCAQGHDDMVTAILHDVVEKSNGIVTINALSEQGYPEHIVEAVDCLSKRSDNGKPETWDDYIQRVLGHPIAMRVKLLDLEDNCDFRRAVSFTQQDAERIERYIQARQRIKQVMMESWK